MDNSSKILVGSILVAGLLIVGLVVFFKPEPEPITLPLKIEEFSDFQCPACAAYTEGVDEIAKYDDVEFTFKHFPLTQIHDRAYSASVASEAAREQDKFMEYHDVIFANQPNFSDEELIKYAEEIELDVEKFTDDYENNQDLKDRVDNDMAEGTERGVNSTPTFYVNGEKLRPNGPDDLVKQINSMIQEAKATESEE